MVELKERDIFVIRHARDDAPGRLLGEAGRSQARIAAVEIRDFHEFGESVVVFATDTDRAKETAGIIAHKLLAGVTVDDSWGWLSSHPKKLEEGWQRIVSSQVGTMVVVTHDPEVYCLARYLRGKGLLKAGTRIPEQFTHCTGLHIQITDGGMGAHLFSWV